MSDKVGANGHDLNLEETHESALERMKSAGLLTISPELFEELYLQPKNAVKGDLRAILGNPTPLALIGFVVGLTPFACTLMGWRGTSNGPNTGAANIGDYFFIGGPLLLIAGILEFVLGNTFTYVVFLAFFWTLAASFQPFYNAAGAYSPSGLDSLEGASTPAFNASFGFFLIGCAALNFMFCICATRINVVFFLVFAGASLGFVLAASARWCIAQGQIALSDRLIVGTGASWFSISMLGWYLLAIQLFSTMGIEIPLPVGDLTRYWNKKPMHASHNV